MAKFGVSSCTNRAVTSAKAIVAIFHCVFLSQSVDRKQWLISLLCWLNRLTADCDYTTPMPCTGVRQTLRFFLVRFNVASVIATRRSRWNALIHLPSALSVGLHHSLLLCSFKCRSSSVSRSTCIKAWQLAVASVSWSLAALANSRTRELATNLRNSFIVSPVLNV